MRESELTPDQEEQVRRLLVEARHEGPIPADVAGRLDRVLADLATPGADAGEGATVADLSAQRRRRRAAALLAGAAAVIVGGFAVGQVIDVGGDEDVSSTSAQPVDREGGNAADEEAAGGGAGAPAAPSVPSDTAAGSGGTASTQAPMKLTSDNLQRDLAEQLPGAEARGGAARSGQQAAVDAFQCRAADPAAYGTGRFFPAYYDGIPAVVAVRPGQGGSRRADVLECATAAQLASAVVAAR